MKKISQILFVIALTANIAKGQDTLTYYANLTEYLNETGLAMVTEGTVPQGELFSVYATEFTSDPLNTLTLEKQNYSSYLGYDHYRYQQYYDNIEVEGAEVIEHCKNDYLVFINGRVCEGLDYDAGSLANISDARNTALNEFVGGSFAWDDPDMETDLQEITGDPSASYYPTGELIFALDSFNDLEYLISASRYTLCYRFEITTTNPFERKAVFVNAMNNSVFRTDDLLKYDGDGHTLHYGKRTIDTKQFPVPAFNYYLRANSGNRNIKTRTYDNKWSQGNDITDSDDDWDASNEIYTSAHWYATQAWDYFENTHSHEGMDGSGTKTRVMVSQSTINTKYAYYDNSRNIINFGPGPTGSTTIMLDAVGHEFTHGVIEYGANFSASGESAALEEGFCDIFGFLIEHYVETNFDDGDWDWTIGEDGWLRRNMKYPNLVSHPHTYEGNYWNNTYTYNDTRHVQSAVLSKWFQLADEGGVHNGVSVGQLDLDKLAKFCFEIITTSSISSSQYKDIEALTQVLARKKFGTCSYEYNCMVEAWEAVGVGNGSSCGNVSIPENLNVTELDLRLDRIGEKLIVLNPNVSIEKIFIYSSNGTLISQNSTSNSISTANLPSGVYIAHFQYNGQLQPYKFVLLP